MSRVTKQRIPHPYVRPSASHDSISDEEDSRRGSPIVRSHVRPNKNYDAYAEIRAPRTPQAPHDPTKPARMKHPDLPSTLVSSRDKGGSGSKRSLPPLTPPLSTASDHSSSSDCVPPSLKMRRLPTGKIEVKEEWEGRSVRNEVKSEVSTSRSTLVGREPKKESDQPMKKAVEVETPKPRKVHVEPKTEVKEEMVEVRERRGEEDSRNTRLKIKKPRPSEELTRQVQMKRVEPKKEIKEEVEVITID